VRAVLAAFDAKSKIFGGMAAMVDIIVTERRNVIAIPNLSIGRSETGEYVTVV
jgi:hypothetical protein